MTFVRERGNGNERHHSCGKDRLGQPGRRFSPRAPWNTGTSSVCPTLDRQVVTCLSFIMTDVFEALAAPARRAILDVLCERDGQTLFEICGRLTMKHNLTLTRQAISQHLDVLEAAGLLRSEREGRYKYHYLDTTPLNAIVKRWLTPKRKAGEE
jgi:DNA-binding transcriptional ArsR family regulator